MIDDLGLLGERGLLMIGWKRMYGVFSTLMKRNTSQEFGLTLKAIG